MAEADRCTGCGRFVAGGTAACQADFESLGARDFTEPGYGGVHRMVVEAYTLQHPAKYCISAKSTAAHLCGMCELMDHAGDRALPNEALRRWLDGRSTLVKPALPADRGALTVAVAIAAKGPQDYAAAVERWARSVWIAYAPLHGLARQWLAEAFAQSHQRHG